MPRHLIILIGASGVGKSTLLRNSLPILRLGGYRAQMAQKITTRSLRGDFESDEFQSVTRAEYLRRSRAGDFCVEYELFGELYGLPHASVPSDAPEGIILLQTFPTKVAAQLRQNFDRLYQVRVALLAAPTEIVRSRLIERGDERTSATLTQRLETANRERRWLADKVLDACQDQESVASSFYGWLRGLLGS